MHCTNTAISRNYKEILHRRRPFGPPCLRHTQTRFNKSVTTLSLCVQPFVLAATLVLTEPILMLVAFGMKDKSFRCEVPPPHRCYPMGIVCCALSLEMLNVAAMYNFLSLWYDLAGVLIPNLPYSERNHQE